MNSGKMKKAFICLLFFFFLSPSILCSFPPAHAQLPPEIQDEIDDLQSQIDTLQDSFLPDDVLDNQIQELQADINDLMAIADLQNSIAEFNATFGDLAADFPQIQELVDFASSVVDITDINEVIGSFTGSLPASVPGLSAISSTLPSIAGLAGNFPSIPNVGALISGLPIFGALNSLDSVASLPGVSAIYDAAINLTASTVLLSGAPDLGSVVGSALANIGAVSGLDLITNGAAGLTSGVFTSAVTVTSLVNDVFPALPTSGLGDLQNFLVGASAGQLNDLIDAVNGITDADDVVSLLGVSTGEASAIINALGGADIALLRSLGNTLDGLTPTGLSNIQSLISGTTGIGVDRLFEIMNTSALGDLQNILNNATGTAVNNLTSLLGDASITGNFPDFISNLGGLGQENLANLLGSVSGFGMSQLNSLLSGGLTSITGLVSGLNTAGILNLGNILNSLSIGGLLNNFAGGLTGIGTSVFTGLLNAGISSVMGVISNLSEIGLGSLQSIFNYGDLASIQGVFDSLVGAGIAAFEDFLDEGFTNVGPVFQGLTGVGSQALADLFNLNVPGLPDLLGGLDGVGTGLMQDLLNGNVGQVTDIFNGITPDGMNALQGLLNAGVGNITDVIGNLGLDGIANLTNIINLDVPNIGDLINNLSAGGAGAFTDLLNTNNPALGDLISGIDPSGFLNLTDILDIPGISSSLSSLVGGLNLSGIDNLTTLVNSGAPNIGNLIAGMNLTGMEELTDLLNSAVGDIGSLVGNLTTDGISNLTNLLNSGIPNVGSNIGNLSSSALGTMGRVINIPGSAAALGGLMGAADPDVVSDMLELPGAENLFATMASSPGTAAAVAAAAAGGDINEALMILARAGGCPPGVPCIAPVGEGLNDDKTNSAACDGDFMNRIYAKAYMEAQRQVATDQSSIHKPDSTLEYSCFDQGASNTANLAGSLFSETAHWNNRQFNIGTTSPFPPQDFNVFMGADRLDNSINSTVMNTVTDYIDGAFSGDFLGGLSGVNNTLNPAVSLAAYSCTTMQQVWEASKCDGFSGTTADTFGTLTTFAGTDPRIGTGGCGGSAISQPFIDAVNNVDDEFSVASPYVAYYDRMIGGACTTPIPSGTVARIAITATTDVLGNVTRTEEIFADHFCSNPGCYYDMAGSCVQ